MPPSATPNQNPEQIARDRIDAQLRAAGWAVQDKKSFDFHEGQGQAIREYVTDTGPADYVLFVDRKPVGVIEAKKEDFAHNITTVEDQTGEYAAANLKWVPKTGDPLPFLYESTGVVTRFTDQRDPKPRSREVFSFHRPETFREFLSQEKSLRTRLQDLPALDPTGLRDCQISAITNLEESFKKAKPRALVQMATGSGKTFTAITSIYRLLRHSRAKRILFLVNTRNLAEQAEQEFMTFTPPDDNRKFTELYSVQRVQSSHVPKDAQVCISTIQRMYSILQGRELEAGEEDIDPAEFVPRRKEPLPVVYNGKLPPEFFDFMVIDECHQSIYNLWRQVVEYFDVFHVGLTATPEAKTFAFFNQNVVSEYTHEKAVADGVNVGNEVFLIDTQMTRDGGTVLQGLVEKREKLTRAKRWEQTDEDEKYSAKSLDRDVVSPSQIRTVIRAYRDSLPVIFPDREEVPKTLIFAKTDSHADDIIQIVREEFDEENRFCKKITYKNEEDPKSVLSQFRNDFYPRIAVTVDMIATGTDVRPLECLLFMRDVRSRGYFEQMKGRGTRTLDLDGLRKVTPSAKTAKTHYVIVDAVGVTKSLKTASPTLITRPSVPFKDLAMEVVMGAYDADTVSSLAGRLARIERQLTPEQKDEIAKKAGGTPLTTIIKNLFAAIDGDTIEQRALEITGLPPGSETGTEAREKAQQQLVAVAAQPLTGATVNLIIETCVANLQTIDNDTLDVLIRAEWDADARENAGAMAADFAAFLETRKDELIALTIYYQQPRRRQEVTLAQIKEVLAAIRTHAPKLAPLRVWEAYARLDSLPDNARPLTELTALVALIRRTTGLDETLTPFETTVRRNFQTWIMQKHAGVPTEQKFTESQTAWLTMIRDHIATSFHFEREDLEYSPFDGEGGLGKMHQLFGDSLDYLIDELNGGLVA